ncbi:hypothetical protein FIBSPDRAFT_861240 [Athelia psychrophila]|uniref:Uncharacterized protein n=1 Tax=Athelia psychrophila TaxID=1759441 RepID=A0A166JFF4_9AGAM|nr:hypothetical protein FIBSPDRAFT_861240 [Fibularhizoctonia sp. CBS 109695]
MPAMPTTGDFVVGDFMFCEHGNEYCHDCPRDFRPGNNPSDWLEISEQLRNLPEEQQERVLERLDDDVRVPLRVYNFGIDTSRSKDGDPIFSCLKHSIDDCEDCFDFPKHILQSVGIKA